MGHGMLTTSSEIYPGTTSSILAMVNNLICNSLPDEHRLRGMQRTLNTQMSTPSYQGERYSSFHSESSAIITTK